MSDNPSSVFTNAMPEVPPAKKELQEPTQNKRDMEKLRQRLDNLHEDILAGKRHAQKLADAHDSHGQELSTLKEIVVACGDQISQIQTQVSGIKEVVDKYGETLSGLVEVVDRLSKKKA